MLTSKKTPLEFNSNPSKFKKFHKIKIKKTQKTQKISQKSYILVSPNIKYMPVKQLLSVLKLVKPALKKIGSRKARLKIDMWPNTILTKKPKDIRMGRGKGAPTDRVAIAGATSILSISRSDYFLTKKLFSYCTPKILNSKAIKTSKW